MKTFFNQSISILTTLGLLTLSLIFPAKANFFDQKEVEQSRYIAIAIPRVVGPQLLILEQKTDARKCWSDELL